MPESKVPWQEQEAASGDKYATLTNDLEALLAAARPRLARLAYTYGVPPDSIEDVVQETCINAWQRLTHLRAPDRFEAWLNGICRYVSKRWTYAPGAAEHRQLLFSALDSDAENVAFDMPDPQTPDLEEDLTRQELVVLLDRAMGYLPAASRKALEMHYLAEMPQREVAQQLGVTINALEVKLHRARRQLRQVLASDLRADAESFGLLLDQETTGAGWRETSVWCFLCGQRHLQGIFVPQPGGETSLRMQCPACSVKHGMDLISTGTILSFARRSSFRPALKQMQQVIPSFYAQALATGYQQCPGCNGLAVFRVIEPDLLPNTFSQRFSMVLECPACGKILTSIFSLYLSYLPVSQFLLQHERCILDQEELIEYQGQPAICAGLVDTLSNARLKLILHRQTLQFLALFQT